MQLPCLNQKVIPKSWLIPDNASLLSFAGLPLDQEHLMMKPALTPQKGNQFSRSASLCFTGPSQSLFFTKTGLHSRVLESRRRFSYSQFCVTRRQVKSATRPTMIKTEGDLMLSQTIPETTLPSTIRPMHIKNFSVPYEDFVVRAWQPRDRLACMELIRDILMDYGLEWDPVVADRDVVEVEDAYSKGEFWVVEDVLTARIVGTAAFYEVPHRGRKVVEIRKMYLSKNVRGLGMGTFLLSALEQRALQLGYTKVIIETATVLKEACRLYDKHGYTSSTGLETERCDVVLEKPLRAIKVPEGDHIEVIDSTRGWTVVCVPRRQAQACRLLGRAVVVLVESGGKILVHKRSMRKSTYPGRIAAVVTGCVDWMEDPLAAAKREVFEEVGIDNLDFSEAFAPYVSKAQDRHGQRIQFHPYVARGDFGEGDIVCDQDEVESAWLMTREDVIGQQIGGSLWQDFREHGL